MTDKKRHKITKYGVKRDLDRDERIRLLESALQAAGEVRAQAKSLKKEPAGGIAKQETRRGKK